MQNQPRGQHYVPRFYLAGFADAHGVIHVLDQQRRKQRTSIPEQVAKENHFYTVETGALADPYVVERWLSELEADCAQVIREIVANKSLPSGSALGTMITFIAMMYSRVPGIRDTLSEFLEEGAELIDFAWREIAQRRHVAQASNNAKGEQPRRQVETNDEASLCNQTTYVQLTMEMVRMLFPMLAQRHWSLWEVVDDTCDLICSDRPAGLNWTEPMSDLHPPGFNLPGTVVTIPLTSRLAVVGTIAPCAAYRKITSREVADLNSATGQDANQLYSSKSDFVWRMKNGQIGRAADLLAAIQPKP